MISSIALLVLIVLLLIAATTDFRENKIYNWTTYPGILLGFTLRAMEGWSGLEQSIAGFFLCGIIMVVCFVFFSLGGGDVKLMAMVGAFLGPGKGIEAMLWTFILGACLAVVLLIWKFGILSILKGTCQHIWMMCRTMRWIPLTKEDREPLQWGLFLGPVMLLAVLVVSYETWAKWNFTIT